VMRGVVRGWRGSGERGIGGRGSGGRGGWDGMRKVGWEGWCGGRGERKE
jgi:hypothetical protein